MGVHAAETAENQALVRIVAMLIALAALAERVHGRSRPVRCLVLWILRPAEAVARGFVDEVTSASLQPSCRLSAFGTDGSSDDALRLALSFRSMAATLDDVSRNVLRLAMDTGGLSGERLWAQMLDTRHSRRAGVSAAPLAEISSMTRCLWARKPHDTS